MQYNVASLSTLLLIEYDSVEGGEIFQTLTQLKVVSTYRRR